MKNDEKRWYPIFGQTCFDQGLRPHHTLQETSVVMENCMIIIIIIIIMFDGKDNSDIAGEYGNRSLNYMKSN